jgi:TonB family protein
MVLAAAIVCAGVSPLLGLVAPSWEIEFTARTPVERADGLAPGLSAAAVTRADLGESSDGAVTAPPPQKDAASSLARVGDLFLAVWAAGATAALCLLCVGLLRLRWIGSHATPARHGRWPEIAADIAQQYGLPRPPVVLRSGHPTLLATWGFQRPKVILPWSAPTWTEERIRIVLGHELAHVHRRDWLIQLGAQLVRSIYWFNPIVWAGCRRLRHTSEEACDDAVLRMGVDASAYATHLLDLARTFRLRPMWLPAPAIARPSSLERRVTAMLNGSVDRQPLSALAAVAVVVAVLGVTVPIAGLTVFAQTRFATVFGTATDQTGAILVNAALALSNVQTNARYEVRTNQSGYFELVGLLAGDYVFEVRHVGFENLRENVSLGVGESLQKNVTLRLGSVQETIVTIDGPCNAVQGGCAPPVRGTARSAAVRTRSDGSGPRPCPNPALLGGCIGPPLKLKDVRPLYPRALTGTGMEGTVFIEGQIGTDGKMKNMRITASPHPAFERAALDAVGEWEFQPTTLNGRVVETPIHVSVSFHGDSHESSRPHTGREAHRDH